MIIIIPTVILTFGISFFICHKSEDIGVSLFGSFLMSSGLGFLAFLLTVLITCYGLDSQNFYKKEIFSIPLVCLNAETNSYVIRDEHHNMYLYSYKNENKDLIFDTISKSQIDIEYKDNCTPCFVQWEKHYSNDFIDNYFITSREVKTSFYLPKDTEISYGYCNFN